MVLLYQEVLISKSMTVKESNCS